MRPFSTSTRLPRILPCDAVTMGCLPCDSGALADVGRENLVFRTLGLRIAGDGDVLSPDPHAVFGVLDYLHDDVTHELYPVSRLELAQVHLRPLLELGALWVGRLYHEFPSFSSGLMLSRRRAGASPR